MNMHQKKKKKKLKIPNLPEEEVNPTNLNTEQ